MVALASCAFGDPTTPAQQLRAEVAGMPGLAPDAAVVLVSADSEKAAWGRIVRARTEEPLEESRVLSLAFEATAEAPAQIVVGGPYPKLVEQVLLDAFALVRLPRLAGLTLVQVSAELPSARLLAVCAERRARCEHRRWSGAPE